jgi:predicted metal-binding membrane protein
MEMRPKEKTCFDWFWGVKQKCNGERKIIQLLSFNNCYLLVWILFSVIVRSKSLIISRATDRDFLEFKQSAIIP